MSAMTDRDRAERVAFLDVGAGYHELRASLDGAWRRVMEGGRYILGDELGAFESEWARYAGARHAVGVASGLDALTLTLRALGIGPGDEVLVPSNTFIATWLAVSRVGATPVPVEPDPATHLVSADAMRAAIGPRTAALLPVHLYGRPVDVVAMEKVAADAGLALVFDACQAHGARVGGRPVGAFGQASAWSFYPGKNLGAYGDGGAVTTNDEALAVRIRRLRNYGSERKHEHPERGENSRLDELQAALLRVKLASLDAWNERRAGHARHYDRALRGLGLGLPVRDEALQSAWHLYVVQCDARDTLRQALAERGVETLVHYPVPPHVQPAYADLGLAPDALPIARSLAERVLSLPCGPHLAEHERERVIDALTELLV